ncbi:MAG: hypothetical protein L0Y72_08115 [Gemmataceae bacterium]|nr:hypothetical protein [Gemmataceae bacterium]MCI0738993.1 hypothetical protein [Gemmataceae bacterium]
MEPERTLPLQHVAAGPPPAEHAAPIPNASIQAREEIGSGPSVRARSARDPAWNTVLVGLGMMFWTMRLTFVGFFLVLLLAFLFGGLLGGRGVNWDWLKIGLYVASGLAAVGGILHLVGQGLCCSAPLEAGARRKVVGSLIAYAAAFGCAVGFAYFCFAGVQPFERPRTFDAPWLLAWMTFLTAAIGLITGQVLFLLFLKRLCVVFRNDKLAGTANHYLFALGVLVATHVVLQGLRLYGDATALLIQAFVITLAVLLHFALVLAYMFHLVRVRLAIHSALRMNDL